jgi:GNAT superfamily N-acetyltransferase
MSAHHLRPAEPRDLPAIIGLITELAEFERLTHLLAVTPEKLAPHLFGAVDGTPPVARCQLAEVQGDDGPQVVGFALFFRNFSTFLAQPGLYLEDLYVQPAHRGSGIAVAEGCGRFEWSVLDWNANAIAFYQQMGATVMPDWRVCRVAGEALAELGAPTPD